MIDININIVLYNFDKLCVILFYPPTHQYTQNITRLIIFYSIFFLCTGKKMYCRIR